METKVRSLWEEIAQDGVKSVVDKLSDSESMEMTERYGAHNYHPLPVNVTSGDGAVVYDGNGKRYIDCIGAYSAVAHGHLNKAVLDATREQLDSLTLTSRATYASELALFLKGLADYADMDMVCPMNTGAEAVETAIKLARKWGYTKKGIPEDQAEFLVCTDNFHGRTTTIVGFSTEEQYKRGFGPFTPGFKLVPFGDIEAIKQAITPNTCAFLAEPIQAEGGIIIPPDGFLAELRQVLSDNNTLLIWDEVQTGFCRTGKKFAWMYEDAKPDLLAVGKPLGGGVMPVSAALGSREVMEVFEPGDHGSTFGGNPLGCVVALAALAEMEVKDYCGRAKRLGERMMSAFRQFDFPFIKDLRARGLLVGLEVDETVDSHKLGDEFVKNGILTKETRSRTFRFTPPIIMTDEQMDEVLEGVEKSLRAVTP
jgi:ornithine--oxo-acid transaminase